MDAAPAPGTVSATTPDPNSDADRPTVRPRQEVAPLFFERDAPGHDPTDPLVRRFWTAVVGPTAVAELLRLVAAARGGNRIPEPLRLAALAAEGLIERSGDTVLIRPRIPHLGPSQLNRLTPALRVEYLAAMGAV